MDDGLVLKVLDGLPDSRAPSAKGNKGKHDVSFPVQRASSASILSQIQFGLFQTIRGAPFKPATSKYTTSNSEKFGQQYFLKYLKYNVT